MGDSVPQTPWGSEVELIGAGLWRSLKLLDIIYIFDIILVGDEVELRDYGMPI